MLTFGKLLQKKSRQKLKVLVDRVNETFAPSKKFY